MGKQLKKEVVNITVVIDEDSQECLYSDGLAWESRGEITVYVTDLIAASGGLPIELKHVEIDFKHDEWPDLLEDAILRKGELTHDN